MATIIRGTTGMEQKIRKTKQQLFFYRKAIKLKHVFSLSVDIVTTIVSGIFLYMIHPALMVIGFIIGFLTSRMIIKKDIIINWLSSRERDRTFYLHYLENKQQGENNITETLESNINNNFYLINGAIIHEGEKKKIRIPHLLLCPDNTVACIESQNLVGYFSAKNDKWKRTIRSDEGQNIQENNLTDLRKKSWKSAKQLNNILKHQFKNVDTNPVVVMSNHSNSWIGKQEDFCPIIHINELGRFIREHYKENTKRRETSDLRYKAHKLQKLTMKKYKF